MSALLDTATNPLLEVIAQLPAPGATEPDTSPQAAEQFLLLLRTAEFLDVAIVLPGYHHVPPGSPTHPLNPHCPYKAYGNRGDVLEGPTGWLDAVVGQANLALRKNLSPERVALLINIHVRDAKNRARSVKFDSGRDDVLDWKHPQPDFGPRYTTFLSLDAPFPDQILGTHRACGGDILLNRPHRQAEQFELHCQGCGKRVALRERIGTPRELQSECEGRLGF